MSQPWVAILRNPHSGAGSQAAHLRELVAELRRHGLRPRLFSRREWLTGRLQEAGHRESLVGLVAAGGDGTVNDVINRYPDIPLAVLPLGTENLVARHLGIVRSGRGVAEMIAAGRTRRLDVGTVNGRRFAIMAGVGFDADVVHRLHAQRRGNIRRRLYLRLIWESWRQYHYPEFRLYCDDATEPVVGRVAVIANLPVYGFGLRFAAAAAGDDGRLDVRSFPPRSAFQFLRYFLMVARTAHERSPDVHRGQAARIRIEADEPVPIQIDGEPAGWTPAEVALLPGALEVFVP